MNLNHLHLHVASVPRAAEFYRRYFGLRELVWHGEMVFMRDEAGMDPALAPAERVEAMPPWFHFGFRLEGRDAVGALCERTAAEGVAIATPVTTDGDLTFFRCADPDGYALEVCYEPDPA